MQSNEKIVVYMYTQKNQMAIHLLALSNAFELTILSLCVYQMSLCLLRNSFHCQIKSYVFMQTVLYISACVLL